MNSEQPNIPKSLSDLAAKANRGETPSPADIKAAFPHAKMPARGIVSGRMPVVFRDQINHEWFRVFTWRERLAILFGANFVVAIVVMCQHKPGNTQPVIGGKISKHNTAKEHLASLVKYLESETPIDNEKLK